MPTLILLGTTQVYAGQVKCVRCTSIMHFFIWGGSCISMKLFNYESYERKCTKKCSLKSKPMIFSRRDVIGANGFRINYKITDKKGMHDWMKYKQSYPHAVVNGTNAKEMGQRIVHWRKVSFWVSFPTKFKHFVVVDGKLVPVYLYGVAVDSVKYKYKNI